MGSNAQFYNLDENQVNNPNLVALLLTSNRGFGIS